MKLLIVATMLVSNFAFASTDYERSVKEIKAALDSKVFQQNFGNEPIKSMFRLSSGSGMMFVGNDEACGTIVDIEWKENVPVVTDAFTACEK